MTSVTVLRKRTHTKEIRLAAFKCNWQIICLLIFRGLFKKASVQTFFLASIAKLQSFQGATYRQTSITVQSLCALDRNLKGSHHFLVLSKKKQHTSKEHFNIFIASNLLCGTTVYNLPAVNTNAVLERPLNSGNIFRDSFARAKYQINFAFFLNLPLMQLFAPF